MKPQKEDVFKLVHVHGRDDSIKTKSSQRTNKNPPRPPHKRKIFKKFNIFNIFDLKI
jgi:hypothetical protein